MGIIKGTIMTANYYVHQFMEDKREYPSEFSKRVTEKYEDRSKTRLSQEQINSIDGYGNAIKDALRKTNSYKRNLDEEWEL